MPRQVLILGARGMVGRSWTGLLTAHGVPFRALARPDFDLQDPSSLAAAVGPTDDLVINAAAWTAVDDAEVHEAEAARANGDAPTALARRCSQTGACLVHYSTDYVFNGRAALPYPIDAPIQPVNAYGRSKAAGEAGVRKATENHLIIRTSWVYAPWGKNFVRTIAGLAAVRDSLKVVDDQRGRPTSAEQLTRTTLALYLAGAIGTWHATDGGECSWHEFASEIVRILGYRCRVDPCSTEEFPRPAARPAFSTLDLTATEDVAGSHTPWTMALADVLRRIDTVT
jgi:dTDP-4-dehydrorhamnose reductase